MSSESVSVSSETQPILLLLSGPNLQLFGEREPEIYGSETLAERVARSLRAAEGLGWRLEHVQSDSESDLVNAVHNARHYGWSLHDALASFEGVIVELHVSNPMSREKWRSDSVITPIADGSVAGFGGLGYELAVEAAIRLVREA